MEEVTAMFVFMNAGVAKRLPSHSRGEIIARARSVCTIRHSECLYMHWDLQLNIRNGIYFFPFITFIWFIQTGPEKLMSDAL